MSILAQDLFHVKGLVAVITGGGSGLGLHAARALDANGAKAVYIVGRRKEVLEKAAAEAPNKSLIPIVGDVSNKASLLAVADRVRRDVGYVNLVYANAGITGPDMTKRFAQGKKPSLQELQQGLLEDDMDAFTNTYHVNDTSVVYTVLAFLDLLDAGNKQGNLAQSSQVIIASSVAGLSRSTLLGFQYSSSKAAALHIMKMLSTYFVDYNIRVNALCPGLYPSDMTDGAIPTDKHENKHGAFAGAVDLPATTCPARRSGSEQDYAGVILFLSSIGGAYINGLTLVTDGGRVAVLPAVY